jgi:carbamoyltransferase
VGYTEASIGALLGVESLQRIEATHLHYYDRFKLPENDPLCDLIRLFLLRSALPKARLHAVLGTDVCDTLIRLGLLIERGDQWSSRVDLYCVESLFIATDHRYMLLDEDRLNENPVMYIGMDSRGLVHAAPRHPTRRALDLCTGSGVQALSASRYSEHVTGVDINPRAVRFARFNAQLNGIDNVRFIEGDLYRALDEPSFDLILANPPFVPSPHKALGFRDGGASGESILARIVAEADAHLSPHGVLHLVTDLVDVRDYEQKLTRWWRGAPAHMLVLHTADRDEILFAVPHAHAPFGQRYADYNDELTHWVRNFRSADLGSVNFGYVFIRRSASGSHGYTARVIHNPTAPIHAQVNAYFSQRELLETTDAGTLTVRLHPDAKLREEYAADGTPCGWEITVPDNPYYTTYRVEADVFQILRMIGQRPHTLDVAAAWIGRNVVTELIYKGLLHVSSASAALFHAAGETSTLTPSPIDEQPTKTTPTCLSSYLSQ